MIVVEKTLVIVAASALAANEASSGGFPLSTTEVWTYVCVLVAAIFASLATESSKRRLDIPFYAPAFWGNVGLGVMAGLCLPLLIGAVFEYFSHQHADVRASVGLSILGAYVGRDALAALWAALQAIGALVAKLKGLQVSFKPPEDKNGGEPDER